MMPYKNRLSGAILQNGMKALWFGDSLGDPFYYGQAWGLICAQAGLVKLGGNLINNGNFESGITDWAAEAASCTITQSATQAKFNGNSLRMQPTSAGQTANWALCSPGGGAGQRDLGMQLGRAYTFSAWVFVPTGTLGNVYLSITDNDGTGQAATTSGVAVANSTWQLLSVSRTLRPYSGSGLAEAFVRFNWSGSAGQVDSTKFVYIDGAQLDTGIWSGAQLPAYVGDAGSRSSIGGTLLTAKSSDPNNALSGTTLFAARCGNLAPDVVIVDYGINDWFNAASYGISASDWRTAVRTCLSNIAAMTSKPQIVWVGLTTTTNTGTTPPTTGWTGYDLSTRDTFKRAMNMIAREECRDAHVPFVSIFPLMPTSLVQANTPSSVWNYTGGADGIHPTQTGGQDGQTFLAQRIMGTLGAM